MKSYLSDDIAIISIGVVLPDTKNFDEFAKTCFRGESVFREIDADRWRIGLSYSEDRSKEDKTYSSMAAQIREAEYLALRNKHKLDNENDHRMLTYLVEAYDQVIRGLKGELNIDKMSFILGAMNPDERMFKERLLFLIERLKDTFRQDYPDLKNYEEVDKLLDFGIRQIAGNIKGVTREGQFPSSVFARLKDLMPNHYNGEGWIVDSACSSSLTSLEIASNLLKTRKKDLVIAGGVESNLSNGAFVIFSKVGALSQSISRPFDQRHDGIVQGEGAVLFALERLEDALRNGREIHGILKNVDGASDGRSASLFQPTVEGQVLAYDKVWSNISEKPFFIESHGTGTSVGDEVERASLMIYFNNRPFYLGAVKGIYGHTKSSAGAVGVLKGLCIFKQNQIPGNKFIEETIFSEDKNIIMNKENTPITTDMEYIGVSSLGFGGCNYHAALQRFIPERVVTPVESQTYEYKIDVIKSIEVSLDEIVLEKMSKNYFPPKSFNQIDKLQIAAVEAVERMFPNTSELMKSLGTNRVNVVSCGRLGLAKLDDLVDRISVDCFLEEMKSNISEGSKENDIRQVLVDFATKFKSQIPQINEDYGPGILNNVIAGRVANVFNLRGKTYHIDMDLGSLSAALVSIGLELALKNDQIFFLIDTTGHFDENRLEYSTESLKVYMLAHPDYSRALGLGKEGTFYA